MIKYRFLGPLKRLTPWQACACGMAFTTYWAHRETKHHKDAMKKWRREEREQRKQAA